MKSLYCVNDPVNFADFDGLSLKELWNKAKNVVTKTVDAVKNVAKKTVSAVKSVVTNVAGKVSTAAKAVTQTVKTVVNTAKTVAGIARTDGLKNALSGLPAAAKATAWQGKVIQAAAKAAIQADNARTAQELAETKAEARQIVADWAGGVYEEFSPRNQKIIDDTVEKVRELLANGASPAEIKRVIRGACTEVAKNVGETVSEGVQEEVVKPIEKNWQKTIFIFRLTRRLWALVKMQILQQEEHIGKNMDQFIPLGLAMRAYTSMAYAYREAITM